MRKLKYNSILKLVLNGCGHIYAMAPAKNIKYSLDWRFGGPHNISGKWKGGCPWLESIIGSSEIQPVAALPR